tara:strand:+ start:4610 stop:5974 length:1365 start_codon:yes stop_codon:yes gene_type:complete
MNYLSTRNNKVDTDFITVLFKGLAEDGGLFLPKKWPKINLDLLKGMDYNELAFTIIFEFINKSIRKDDLEKIIHKSYENFNQPLAPLVNIDKNKFILELFHGPTLAFKDYAMQFLGNIFNHFQQQTEKKITILGATSGDTGSAAINSFKGKDKIKIFILHPYNKVSEFQKRQMTTITDNNVFNISLRGNFDDCQKIVKELFLDSELQSRTSLTAINSINWARLLAQIVYFFWGWIQSEQKKVSFIVPSGNFGNIFSARIAKYMGLPIDKLHLVTNSNEILHRTISSGKMEMMDVKETYSPSMDIQISSNFERQIFESLNRDSNKLNKIMTEFYKQKSYQFSKNILNDLQQNYISHSVANNEIIETIKLYLNNYNYLADPHTATGLNVMNKINTNSSVIALACAHPSKFGEVIQKAVGFRPNLPQQFKNIFDKKEKFIILDNRIENIKKYILNNI